MVAGYSSVSLQETAPPPTWSAGYHAYIMVAGRNVTLTMAQRTRKISNHSVVAANAQNTAAATAAVAAIRVPLRRTSVSNTALDSDDDVQIWYGSHGTVSKLRLHFTLYCLCVVYVMQ